MTYCRLTAAAPTMAGWPKSHKSQINNIDINDNAERRHRLYFLRGYGPVITVCSRTLAETPAIETLRALLAGVCILR